MGFTSSDNVCLDAEHSQESSECELFRSIFEICGISYAPGYYLLHNFSEKLSMFLVRLSLKFEWH